MIYVKMATYIFMMTLCSFTTASAQLATHEDDFVVHNFTFYSGERLPELRLHYTTIGVPKRDKNGEINNAVLILHGTTGDGHQFLQPQFSEILFVPGGLLDANKYFIILPDAIGHGKSSKPSDGLHAHFPKYDYDDMVSAQYALVTKGLKIKHLRLVMGTSMGCMHTFVWGETYPKFADSLMPLACLPVEIAGRNRMWRKMIIDAIQNDPAWLGGNYQSEPVMALRLGIDMLILSGDAPLPMQLANPTRNAADKYLDNITKKKLAQLDANDLLYQVAASRNYNPLPSLEKISAPVMWVNSADDFINPPELGIAEKVVKRLPHGRFVLIPLSANTHGHATHTWAVNWQTYLAELLKKSQPKK